MDTICSDNNKRVFNTFLDNIILIDFEIKQLQEN